MGLVEDLGTGPVALDTAVFIYFMERDERFHAAVRPVFQAVEEGRLRAVTSELTLMEVLVAPYRARNLALAEQYEELLTLGRGLRMRTLDRVVLRSAAQLRAGAKMNPPDALQVAAALVEGCTVFLTNDRRIPPVEGLSVLQLSDYAASHPPLGDGGGR